MRKTPLFGRRKQATAPPVIGTRGLLQADAAQLSAFLTSSLGRKVTSKVRAKDLLCMSVAEIKAATGLKKADLEKLRLLEVLKKDRDEQAREEKEWGMALTKPPPLPEEMAAQHAVAAEDGEEDYSWISGNSAVLVTDSNTNGELHAMVDELFRDEDVGEGHGEPAPSAAEETSSSEPDLAPPTMQAPMPPPRRR